VFQEKRPYCDGHVENDLFELEDVRGELGIRSTIAVPLDVSHSLRGVLVVCSIEAERFGEPELQLLQFMGYWIGLVAQQQVSERDGQLQPG
jgi:GAF domain-containing protein